MMRPTARFYRVRVGKISGEEAAQQFRRSSCASKESFTPFVSCGWMKPRLQE